MPYDVPMAVWPYYSSMNTSPAKERDNNSLGKDDFLKILVAQLQNQDPMQPMEDKEFIAQMAQFSSVEQIQTMREEMSLLRQSMGVSSDLIGKTVGWAEWTSTGKLDQFSGVVESVLFSEGKLHVQIGQKYVPLDDIYQVWAATESGGSEDGETVDEDDAFEEDLEETAGETDHHE